MSFIGYFFAKAQQNLISKCPSLHPFLENHSSFLYRILHDTDQSSFMLFHVLPLILFQVFLFLIQRSFSAKLNFLQIWIELFWYHFHKHTVSLPFLIPFLLFLPCASTQSTQCYFPTIINKCEAIHLVDSFLFLTPLFFIVGLFVISINQLLKFLIKYLILVFFLAY